MQDILKTGNRKLWSYIGILMVMAGLWKAGEAINIKLGALPVKTAPKAAQASATLDQKNFYAVWVKQISAAIPVPADDAAATDAIFRQKPEVLPLAPPLPTKPPEPDYRDAFKQSASITGVSDDGIFVNGSFYRIGQKLDELTIMSETGKPITPVLASMKGGQATFLVGKHSVVFLIGKE